MLAVCIACLIIRVQVRFLSGTGADRFFAKAIPFHSMEEQQQRKEMIGGGGMPNGGAFLEKARKQARRGASS